jgi:hypothetical protein
VVPGRQERGLTAAAAPAAAATRSVAGIAATTV